MHCPEGNCMEVSPRLLHPVRCNDEKNRVAQMEDGRQLGQGSGREQVGERTIEELSAELGRIEPRAFPTVERSPWTACGICITKTGKRAARHAAR